MKKDFHFAKARSLPNAVSLFVLACVVSISSAVGQVIHVPADQPDLAAAI